MITGELKSKVDKIWDTMWSGGVSNPLSVIEQLTYLLFIKRLDELHTLKERKAQRLGQSIDEPVFEPDEDHLRWSRFKDKAPEQMFNTVRDEVFPFIKTLGTKGEEDGEGGNRQRRPERPVSYSASHNQADGGYDCSHAKGCDLRSGLWYCRFSGGCV